MKHALIVTHVGSGGTPLCRVLSTSLEVRCFGGTGTVYDRPESLLRARREINAAVGLETNEDSDWYIDKLQHNYQFSCKPLYDYCKFIYMVRSPKVPLATLISRGYCASGAEAYYSNRLRRMCEMARKTGGTLLTYEDLVSKRALPLLKNALKLRSSLSDHFTPLPGDEPDLASGRLTASEEEVSVPEDSLVRCERGYSRYLKFLESRTSLVRFAGFPS